MNPVKLLIADDHTLIIDGLKSTLSDVPEVELVGFAKDGNEVMALVAKHKVDLILLDINMPEMSGYETALALKKSYPGIKIIALTMYDDMAHLNKMLQAGVRGYLLKSVRKEELLLAIDKVMDGAQHFSSEMTLTLTKNSNHSLIVTTREKLTPRELEVLVLIVQGLSNNKIAELLNVSIRTIETHRTNLMRKAGVNKVAELIKYAYQNKLV